MANRIIQALMLIVMLMVPAGAQARGSLTAEELSCEYLENPLGIDVQRPRLSWKVKSPKRKAAQMAYRILVASDEKTLRMGVGDLWDSGRVVSLATTQIEYEGKALAAGQVCHWKVMSWDEKEEATEWSAPARWSMGPLKPEDWTAEWIGMPAPEGQTATLEAPWLRKEFTLPNAPRLALATVATLGYSELYLNGEKAGDDVLSPAVSDYSKRALYVTYDVTAQLAAGENCIGLWLGRGWYAEGLPGVLPGGPMARVQLDITLENGEQMRVNSDGSWRAHTSSITFLDGGPYSGERHDAGKAIPDWSRAGLDATPWSAARVGQTTVPLITAQMAEPNRLIQTMEPVAIENYSSTETIIDMGRNYTGWIELRMRQPAGREVLFEYIEQRNPGEPFVTYNQRDVYITRGGDEETFRNRFQFRAFRWVKISGMEPRPEMNDIKGYLIHTGYKDVGSFACSDDLMNKIHDTVVWTYRCLSLGGYCMDCPHRERLGYGDGQVTKDTAFYHFTAAGLHTKWLKDWRDAQDPKTGKMPNTAPYPWRSGGGPTWGAICVTLPWTLYTQYGDKRILEESYESIRRYVAYLDSLTVNNVMEEPADADAYSFLGDWVAPGRDQLDNIPWSPKECRVFWNDLYFIYLMGLTQKIATVLEKPQHAAAYGERIRAVRAAVHEKYYKPETQTYVNGEQPYLAFALLTGIMPTPLRSGVMESYERELLINNGGHLNSGMAGTYFVIDYLNQAGRDDLIYLMASQRTYPGWGYMIDQGATTIWERWDGKLSQIHSCMLSIGSWFQEGIAGIQSADYSPGFKHIVLRPALIKELSWARGEYDSIQGLIKSEWRRKGDGFKYLCTIPPNTTATLYLPVGMESWIMEGGRGLGSSEGIRGVVIDGQMTAIELDSGSYEFDVN